MSECNSGFHSFSTIWSHKFLFHYHNVYYFRESTAITLWIRGIITQSYTHARTHTSNNINYIIMEIYIYSKPVQQFNQFVMWIEMRTITLLGENVCGEFNWKSSETVAGLAISLRCCRASVSFSLWSANQWCPANLKSASSIAHSYQKRSVSSNIKISWKFALITDNFLWKWSTLNRCPFMHARIYWQLSTHVHKWDQIIQFTGM